MSASPDIYRDRCLTAPDELPSPALRWIDPVTLYVVFLLRDITFYLNTSVLEKLSCSHNKMFLLLIDSNLAAESPGGQWLSRALAKMCVTGFWNGVTFMMSFTPEWLPE